MNDKHRDQTLFLMCFIFKLWGIWVSLCICIKVKYIEL